jgi:hypothetical protein
MYQRGEEMIEQDEKLPEIPTWFVRSITSLFARYPQVSLQSLSFVAWWEDLHKFDEIAVRMAIKRATVASPDRIPTCAQIEAHAIACGHHGSNEIGMLTSHVEDDRTISQCNPFHESMVAFQNGRVPRTDDEISRWMTQASEVLGGTRDKIDLDEVFSNSKEWK